ncbi:MAG: glycosyltransferase [Nitrospirae bacterium]|nr:glycosyltransferase [Nitrospirota bacterium]
MLVELFFFLSAAMLFHSWVNYPLLLFFLHGLSRTKRDKPLENGTYMVSVVIPAYNASDKIVDKLKNIIELDFPANMIEIIVVSDGSTDDTVMRAKSIGARNVFVYELKQNMGKSAAQNFGVEHANNEIIVFTDVDSLFAGSFLRYLIPYFADTEIACVGGNALLRKQDGHIDKAHGLYWKIEQFLRRAESDLGMLHSLPGWGFAIRKSDFVPLDSDTGDDMILPLEMALRGKRSVISLDAVVADYMPSSIKGEVNARQRITLRNLTGIMRRKTLLNPFLFPKMSFSIWSHKILRWLSPVFLIALFCSNLWLYTTGEREFYVILFWGQSMVYIIGLAGILGSLRGIDVPLSGFISSFLVANTGFFIGLLNFLKGNRVKNYRNFV